MRRLSLRDYVLTRVFIYGLVVSIVGPMLYIVSSSLTDPAHQAQRIMLFIPQQATLKNYATALEYAANTLSVPVWLMFLSSSICTARGSRSAWSPTGSASLTPLRAAPSPDRRQLFISTPVTGTPLLTSIGNGSCATIP
jgi:hypothetical protein